MQSVSKKVRNAQMERYNVMLVVGDAEVANQTVSVRMRDHASTETLTLPALTKKFDELLAAKK